MTSEGSRRVLNAGFAAILVLVAAGAATDTLIPVAAGVSFLLIALMVFACPPRMAALLFTVQVVLTTLFLARLGFYAGPFPIRIDDAIQIWIFIMWIGAVIDGEGAVKSTGISRLILVLMALSAASFIHGVARGYDPESAGLFLKTMLGYLFYFPAMWLLGKDENQRLLVRTLVWVSIAAAIWVLFKGFTGGEGVYERATSGLRVTSRELNVVMVGLFIAGFTIWKKGGRLPLIPSAVAILVMGAAILLGQSRALWLAVAAGAMAAFVGDMAREGRAGVRLGPVLSRALLVLVFTAGSVAFVAAAGLLTPGDVAARGGGADGGLIGDVSLWARFLSWYEILRTVTASPVTLLFGTGFGHEIHYFRPDLMSMVSIPYVDGSFFQLLLNTGLAGTVVLALLYARGIAGGFRLTIGAPSSGDAVTGMWLTASFTALVIAALSSSLITNYRFSCIWAFLFAVLDTRLAKKGKKG
ncbi:MAG TPA: hypothetical protein PK991_05590 [Candidatus Sabulitectum sp.]|nr:hypothetical protein [Candidatus Sabulitectum sp.]